MEMVVRLASGKELVFNLDEMLVSELKYVEDAVVNGHMEIVEFRNK